MTYQGPRDHIFLYHAYALALGGWMKDKNGNLTTIDSVAPSVLSITGGFGSASVHNLNCGTRAKFPFGDSGPEGFSVYVGHAYTEVRGVEGDDENNPFGFYKTTVRSVLDNVRMNDVFEVEHAEAILMSTHDKPGRDGSVEEGKVVVGDSNMSGVRVAGQRVGLEKRDGIDRVPSYGALQQLGTANIASLCDWNDPNAIPGAPPYAVDFATINQKSQNHLRFSVFKDVDFPSTPGARAFKTSIEVDGFGRIFLGEVMASHGMKQVTMFRIDLGCDNCGGAGGSDGTTNGSPYPP
jgi:hypothetical protein